MYRLGFQKAPPGQHGDGFKVQTGSKGSGGEATMAGDRPWRRAMSQVFLSDCAFLCTLR